MFLKTVKTHPADRARRRSKPWQQALLFWALMLPALAALVAVSWVVLGLLVRLPEWSVEYGFAAITIIATAVSLTRYACRSNPNRSDLDGLQASSPYDAEPGNGESPE